MEALVLGGIALAGMLVNKNDEADYHTLPVSNYTPPSDVKPTISSPSLPTLPSKPTVKDNSSLEHSNLQPFYAKTPNVPDHSDRKLDLYVGEPTFYKSKKEIGQFFEPDETIQTNLAREPILQKSQFDSMFQQDRKFQSVPLQEPIQVGPGVNSPDSQATGGFHPFYRQMPRDYVVTQRGDKGRINHGFSPVEAPTLKQEITVKDYTKFATYDQGTAGNGFTANAPAPESRGQVELLCTQREVENCNVTGRVGQVEARQAPIISTTIESNNRTLSNCNQVLNAHSEHQGNYVDTKQMVPGTQRGKFCETTKHIGSSRNLATFGHKSKLIDKFKTTFRELTTCDEHGGNPRSLVTAPKAPRSFDKFDKGLHKKFSGNPGRMNILQDANERTILTTKKSDKKCHRPGILKANGIQNLPSKLGDTRKSIKIKTQRPLDLDLAAKQLNNNSLHLSLYD